MSTTTRRFFVIFTLAVYWLFGALAVVGALVGIALLFFAPPAGIVTLIVAAVLGVMSWQVKRTWESLTTTA